MKARQRRAMPRGAEAARARTELAERLRIHYPEIEQAALARAHAIADPLEGNDPEYVAGLKGAVAIALEWGIAALADDPDDAAPVPAALLEQARLAARNEIGLDVVLRRYFAGYAVLGDILARLAEQEGEAALGSRGALLRPPAILFERLIGAVSAAYEGERRRRRSLGPERRRLEQVRRLLDGELLDPDCLEYRLGGWQLGLLAAGAGCSAPLRGIAAVLDRPLLLVEPGPEEAWAWLGGSEPVEPERAARAAPGSSKGPIAIAIGEPGEGLGGWRLTHRQARAALPIAQRERGRPVRYAEVALVASILQDDLLSTSLRRLYLDPLAGARGERDVLGETLRAYFAAEQNVTSAAAALGVSRKTVTTRLRSVEERLGRPIGSCSAEIQVALRVEQLDDRASAGGGRGL